MIAIPYLPGVTDGKCRDAPLRFKKRLLLRASLSKAGGEEFATPDAKIAGTFQNA